DETAGAAGAEAGSAAAGQGSGPTGSLDNYNEDFKEFAGEDCVLSEPALLGMADHSLPDPFLMSDGSRLSSSEQWACQRAWLKKSIETFVQGEKPGTPDTVTGTVSATSIAIHVEHDGKTADFSVPIDRPIGALGAVPGVFKADGSGVPTNFVKGEGVAAMNYAHDAMEGAFNKIYSTAAVSVQIKWVWGVSRAI